MATFKQLVDKIPVRLNIGIMLFFSIFFLYVLRSHFSINLLAMVQPMIRDANGTLIELPDYGPRYAWDAYDQSMLLGAYFWGYTITSMPSGVLIDKFGYAKTNIGCTFVICTILVALGPVLAVSFAATLVQRFAIGFVSGNLVPAVNKIISKWSPPVERGKFMSSLFGTDIGTVFTWSVCGVLIENFGWTWAFYVPALLSGLFAVFWYFLVFDTPATHPRILQTEKEHIENSLEGIDQDLKSWPPVWSIITSIPFWALLLLHYGHIWGMFFLLTAAPKFMNEVLGFDLSAAGFLASVPYLVRLFTGIMFGAIGDVFKTKKWISQNLVRKGFCLLSHVIPGLFLVGIPYVSTQPLMCVAFVTLSYGFNGAITMTGYENIHELAPNYATTLYSIANAVASTSGFISPLVVGFFTRKSNTIDDWTIIFVIGAIVYIAPAVFFMIFGSVKIQHWNQPSAKLNQSFDTSEKQEPFRKYE